jgi:hypothetical protein
MQHGMMFIQREIGSAMIRKPVYKKGHDMSYKFIQEAKTPMDAKVRAIKLGLKGGEYDRKMAVAMFLQS